MDNPKKGNDNSKKVDIFQIKKKGKEVGNLYLFTK